MSLELPACQSTWCCQEGKMFLALDRLVWNAGALERVMHAAEIWEAGLLAMLAARLPALIASGLPPKALEAATLWAFQQPALPESIARPAFQRVIHLSHSLLRSCRWATSLDQSARSHEPIIQAKQQRSSQSIMLSCTCCHMQKVGDWTLLQGPFWSAKLVGGHATVTQVALAGQLPGWSAERSTPCYPAW